MPLLVLRFPTMPALLAALWYALLASPAACMPVRSPAALAPAASLPSPLSLPGPVEGDYTGVTRDGGGQGTGGLDPVTYSADISVSGWTPSSAGFTAAAVTMEFDLSTAMFPESIRSQGECNSCWALTATEHFQAVLTITEALPPLPTGENARLSAQELIDCDTRNHGCEGGQPSAAFDFLANHGLSLGFEYTYPVNGQANECAPVVSMPYQGGGVTYKASPLVFLAEPCLRGECPPDASKEQSLLDFWKSSPFKSQSSGQTVLLPMIAYVDAKSWSNFTGGMFDASQCSHAADDLSHIVQIVGYGTDNASGAPFWLVRNTWSSYWGEDGHIRLPFGVNACGLFNYIVYSPGHASATPTPDAPNKPWP